MWSRSFAYRFTVYLSAATGNRAPETVIKVKAKPTGRLKHIGQYSMHGEQMSQGGSSQRWTPLSLPPPRLPIGDGAVREAGQSRAVGVDDVELVIAVAE